jgi:hypothetical protein
MKTKEREMDESTMLRLIEQEKKESNKRIMQIQKKYAFSNNPFKIGDILQDHYQIIEVSEIKFTITIMRPECVYKGIKLTKKLKPLKNGEKTTMYQSNVKRKLNED